MTLIALGGILCGGALTCAAWGLIRRKKTAEKTAILENADDTEEESEEEELEEEEFEEKEPDEDDFTDGDMEAEEDEHDQIS